MAESSAPIQVEVTQGGARRSVRGSVALRIIALIARYEIWDDPEISGSIEIHFSGKEKSVKVIPKLDVQAG